LYLTVIVNWLRLSTFIKETDDDDDANRKVRLHCHLNHLKAKSKASKAKL